MLGRTCGAVNLVTAELLCVGSEGHGVQALAWFCFHQLELMLKP
jgi:hypothetical protein